MVRWGDDHDGAWTGIPHGGGEGRVAQPNKSSCRRSSAADAGATVAAVAADSSGATIALQGSQLGLLI